MVQESRASVLDLVDLEAISAIATGGGRRIYAHPSDDKLLIKVIDQSSRSRYMMRHRIKRWYKRFQRASAYRGFIGEFSESVTISARNPDCVRLPLARVVGVTRTTQGPGLMVEKIRGIDRALAPTVEQLVRAGGLQPALREELDAFLATLIDAHVVVNDMSAANIVRGVNADGHSGLFLIDGFGVKQKIPLYALSKTLNGRHLTEKFGEMIEWLQRAAPKAERAMEAPSLIDEFDGGNPAA